MRPRSEAARQPLSRRALLSSAGAGVGLAGVATDPAAGQSSTAAESTWELRLGGSGAYAFRDVAVGDRVGYLAGVAPAGDRTSAWVVRFLDGRPTWLETYGGDRPARATSVVPGPDGGAIVGGALVAAGTDTERGWVFAVDDRGAVRWRQSFSGTRGVVRSVTVAPDGTVLVAGRAASGLTGVEGWLAGLRPDGNVRWTTTYDDDLKLAFNAIDVVAGEPRVVGLASPRGDTGDGLFATVRTGGGLSDRRRYDLDGLATGVTAIAPGDDGAIVAGTREGPRDEFDVWAARVDASGRRRWTATYGRSRRDRLADAARTPDGGAVLVARSDERSGSARDAWVLRIGMNGRKRWGRTFGGAGDDRGDGVAVVDGTYVVAGTYTTRRDGRQGWATRRPLDDAPDTPVRETLTRVGVGAGLLSLVGGAALWARRRS